MVQTRARAIASAKEGNGKGDEPNPRRSPPSTAGRRIAKKDSKPSSSAVGSKRTRKATPSTSAEQPSQPQKNDTSVAKATEVKEEPAAPAAPEKKSTSGTKRGGPAISKKAATKAASSARVAKGEAKTKASTKAATTAAAAKKEKEEAEEITEAVEDGSDPTATRSYFLMKSEPESRVVDGHEMKYSIDDLAAEENQTTHWDGVRNMEARNVMRAMKVGDRAFFYHSNTRRSRPSIVGEVEVVRTAYKDHTAFDQEDPHFDPKSDPDNPRWFMVDVKFLRKFAEPVTLDDVKEDSRLSEMQLRKRSRISVQYVTEAEWKVILELAGETESS